MNDPLAREDREPQQDCSDPEERLPSTWVDGVEQLVDQALLSECRSLAYVGEAPRWCDKMDAIRTLVQRLPLEQLVARLLRYEIQVSEQRISEHKEAIDDSNAPDQRGFVQKTLFDNHADSRVAKP